MIPKQDELLLPFLKLTRGNEIHLQTAVRKLGEEFNLTKEELLMRYRNGNLQFENRVSFAKTDLKQADLIYYPRRGYSLATALGLEVLNNPPVKIDRDFLKKFKGFRDFLERKGTRKKPNEFENSFTIKEADDSVEISERGASHQIDRSKSKIEDRLSKLVASKVVLGNEDLFGVFHSHPMYPLVVLANDVIKSAYREAKNDEKLAVIQLRHNFSKISKLIDTYDDDQEQYQSKLKSMVTSIKQREPNVLKSELKLIAEPVLRESSALEHIVQTAHRAIYSHFSNELLKRLRQLDDLAFISVFKEMIKAMEFEEPEIKYIEHVREGQSLRFGFCSKQHSGSHVELYMEAIQARLSHLISGNDITVFKKRLEVHKAKSGIIISTTNFDDEAIEKANESPPRIKLVSGEQLADLMIEHEIGCKTKEVLRLMEFSSPILQHIGN